MTATLRVVLDQAVATTDEDLRSASVELAHALIETAPRGAQVAAIVPSDGDIGDAVEGLARIDRVPLKRAQLAAACSMGVVPGIGGGMIHSPTLLAPLLRHDRVHDHDQTVVTLWSLEPWTHPERLPRATVAWHRAMLKRAVKHADAVVVPTHVMAEELEERTKLGGRVRVISGAVALSPAPETEPAERDAPAFIIDAARASADELETALHAVAGIPEASVTLLAEGDGQEALVDVASASGLPDHRLVVVAASDRAERSVLLARATAFIDLSVGLAFPWRMLEALAAGTPVVAASSPQNAEVLADAGQLVAVDGIEPVVSTLRRIMSDGEMSARLRVLSRDRARAFAWRDTAERVWQLHAEL